MWKTPYYFFLLNTDIVRNPNMDYISSQLRRKPQVLRLSYLFPQPHRLTTCLGFYHALPLTTLPRAQLFNFNHSLELHPSAKPNNTPCFENKAQQCSSGTHAIQCAHSCTCSNFVRHQSLIQPDSDWTAHSLLPNLIVTSSRIVSEPRHHIVCVCIAPITQINSIALSWMSHSSNRFMI